MTSTEQWLQVDALLRHAAADVEHASRLVAPGVGAAGADIRQVIEDTVEKIHYIEGLIDDERAAESAEVEP